MFELMMSIPATLLRLENLKDVSNSSVVKSGSPMASLNDFQYSVKLFETD